MKLFKIIVVTVFCIFAYSNQSYASTKVYEGDGLVAYLDDSSITITEIENKGYIAGCFHLDFDSGKSLDGTAYMSAKGIHDPGYPEYASYFVHEYDLTDENGVTKHIHRDMSGNVYDSNTFLRLYVHAEEDVTNDPALLNKVVKYLK
jgi:hypothetical protein